MQLTEGHVTADRFVAGRAAAGPPGGERPSRAPLRGLSIREGLTAATCALIGMGAGVARAGEVDTAVLLYSEADRVTVLEGVVKGRREIGESGRAVGFRLTVDALTGASANGATPADRVQTFTSPSGRSAYTTPTGRTPLNDTFSDRRIAAGATWEEPLGRLSKGSLGLDVSWERDYSSFAASGVLSRDLFLRNTTLVAGASGSWDRVSPRGGAPESFSWMPPPAPGGGGDDDKRALAGGGTWASGGEEVWIFEDDDEGSEGPAKSKSTFDLLAGITQVIDRATILQVNYTRSRSIGYLADPYKLLSVLPAAGGESGTLAGPVGYRFEKRPDARTKHAVLGEAKHHFRRDMAGVSYRYMWDDWGVVSHTIDVRYLWQRDGPGFWEPHVRLYRQTAADFYARFLVDGEPLPESASADYRLGEMATYTVGLKYGRVLPSGHRAGIRVEYYEQRSEEPAGDPRVPSGSDLYPTVRAGIVQLDYSFDW